MVPFIFGNHCVKTAVITFLVSVSSLFGQQDFNKFQTLISKGEIPADFSALTYTKIREDLKNDRTDLRGKKEKIFLEGIHYSIDELLHSGLVIYGDEVSQYVSKVADNLLKNDKDLRSKLRFYTLKSNMTNAFSTDQGIVFVTTGLISQLTSEAQLALVLGHEISHFTQKHVVETFDWRIKNARQNNRIEKLSQYSKDKEFEADKIGLKLYNEAGYAKSEIIPTFDVLMFSYLPFDEVEIPKTYWNTDRMYIPADYFPTEKYDIKAEEDSDDSKSSHPNIRKRKNAMEKELSSFGNWGDKVNILGAEKFNYIREICRFESVRTDVIDANYADVLYSIFLLEKDYPKSLYLQRMKAKAWLGIAQLKEVNQLNNKLQKSNTYEGEVAAVHFFLRKLDKISAATVALRQIEDIRRQNDTDREIKAIWDRMVKTVANMRKFELSAFSTMSYNEANEEFQKTKSDTLTNAPVAEDGEKEKLSKYAKIKKKKEADNPENFNTEKFYLYALGDLIKSDDFLAKYNEYKALEEAKEKKEEDLRMMSNSERKKLKKKEDANVLRLGVTDMLFVEPIVHRYSKGSINHIKSEKLAEDFSEAINETSKDLGMSVTTISSATLKKLGTAGFNERAVLLSYLMQLSEQDNIDVFPVDFDLLDDIKTNYATSKVMFSILEHSYSPKIGAGTFIYSIFFPPLGIAILPYKFFTGNRTDLSVIIMDLEKGAITGGKNYFYKEPLTKLSMQAHVYDVLKQVKSNPL